MMPLPRPDTARRRAIRIGAVFASVLAILVGIAAAAGFFDTDPVHFRPATRPPGGVAALYFSGDMGMRFGMGPPTLDALTAHGVPVLAIGTTTAFRWRRSRAFVDRTVADDLRETLRRTGAGRAVLIGQSFGADILQTGLADLPVMLRRRVAGVILIVPGVSVFFRADPSNIVYLGPPDNVAITTARALRWTRLTCIYGAEERDSLCPALHADGAHVIAMPGGHFLSHDDAALNGYILAAIARTPGILSSSGVPS